MYAHKDFGGIAWSNVCVLSQTSRASSEQALQKRLEEVSEELRQTQSSKNSVQTQLEQAQRDTAALTGQQETSFTMMLTF